MAQLKPGDRVACLLREYKIVSPYETYYESITTFEIVANDNAGYFLFVPGFLFLKESIIADKNL